jgi:SPP1 gp7 family putative phage head morphogenesis protein
MQRQAAALSRAVRPHVMPLAAKIGKRVKRHDAADDEDEDEDLDDDAIDEAELEEETEEIEAAIEDARAAAKAAYDEAEHEKILKTVADRTAQQSKKDFKRLGIDVKKEPDLGALTEKWRAGNVSRIKSVSEEQLDKVEKILRDGFGRRAESIADDLEDQIVGVTRSRLEFIARDQTLTLHSQIAHHRMRACGIKKAIWTSSGDERVRPSHDEADGEEYPIDVGLEVDDEMTFPGEPPNCRCTALPILPELDDDESEGDEGDEGDDDDESDGGDDADE